MKMVIRQTQQGLEISGIGAFDLSQTLECGQCFRFVQETGGYYGVAHGRLIKVSQHGGTLFFEGAHVGDAEWLTEYFDLARDYDEIAERLSVDPWITESARRYRGVHIMRQDPWEALCSFIISQNNNIPRIKKIIAALCELLGEDIGGYHAFPSPAVVASAGEAGLAPIRAGFRAAYIVDAAQSIVNGNIDLKQVGRMDIISAAAELKKIRGVGDKVAACVLLFGYGMLDVFPVDVWIKRVIALRYGEGFTPSRFSPYAGIAQQYLFCRERDEASVRGKMLNDMDAD